MNTSDTIGATVGNRAHHVNVGKNITVVGSGDISDMPDSNKLDEVYRLVWKVSERVARLETWLLALTVVLVVGLVLLALWGF